MSIRNSAKQRWFRWIQGMVIGCVGAFGMIGVDAQDAWSRITPGTFVLIRHADAPGGGDPLGFQLDDCRTQRNLGERGRAQAKLIGRAFQDRKIAIDSVWSSQWCRTRETADLAFPGKRVDQPVFNSFFGEPDRLGAQTRAALNLMASAKGDRVIVVVTHQVNITALTGIVPASGEGVVVGLQGDELRTLARIAPAETP